MQKLGEACLQYISDNGRFPKTLSELSNETTVVSYRADDYILPQYDTAEVDIDLPLVIERPGHHRDEKGGYVFFVGGALKYFANVDDLARRRLHGGGASAEELLLAAAWQGDVQKMKSLLSQGANVNIRGDNRWTPLMKACYRGQTATVMLLIESGADVNTVVHNQTALTLAAGKGYLEIVQSLLGHGAVTDGLVEPSWTPLPPLLAAAMNGYTKVVEALIQHGVSMKTLTANEALKWAAVNRHYDTARLMMANGADINGKDQYGYNALLVAFHANNTDVIDFLISVGADMSAEDKDGFTALAYMVWNGNTETVKSLLAHGADVHVKGLHGMTLLQRAVQSERPAMVELLKNAGASE